MATKELALSRDEKITKLDQVAKSYELAPSEKSPFTNALRLSTAIVDLRTLLTDDVMEPIMQMMNSPLGFLTDRDPNKEDAKPPYPVAVVRECIIEATLRGFYPAGNEMNIIAGRFYAAKNGLRRRVINYPGLADFKDVYDVPRTAQSGEGAIVKCRAKWNLNGKPDDIECEFAIKGYKSTGTDAYTGKAERKLLKRVLDRISGFSTPEGEVGDTEVQTVDVTAEPTPTKPIFPKTEEQNKKADELQL